MKELLLHKSRQGLIQHHSVFQWNPPPSYYVVGLCLFFGICCYSTSCTSQYKYQVASRQLLLAACTSKKEGASSCCTSTEYRQVTGSKLQNCFQTFGHNVNSSLVSKMQHLLPFVVSTKKLVFKVQNKIALCFLFGIWSVFVLCGSCWFLFS